MAYVFDDEEQVLRMVEIKFKGEVKNVLELEQNFIWLANEEVSCFSLYHSASLFSLNFPFYLNLKQNFFSETSTNGTQGVSAKGFPRSFHSLPFSTEIHFVLHFVTDKRRRKATGFDKVCKALSKSQLHSCNLDGLLG